MTRISSADLAIDIAARGAELQSVKSPDGRQWLWHGDPAIWAGRSPLLFPLIGKSPDGMAMVDGASRAMLPHGFARTSDFAVTAMAESHCALRLSDSAATRACYPFAFDLDMTYRVAGATLTMDAQVSNRDTRPMPACFGYHPALVWPLPGSAGLPHILQLDNRQEPELRRIDAQGLLTPSRLASPFARGEMTLHHAMFIEDAMIFDSNIGASLWYGAKGHPGVRVSYPGLPHLGVWQKPGASYICIEPWHGLPAPAGVAEPLEARAGCLDIAPGASVHFIMQMAFGVAQDA